MKHLAPLRPPRAIRKAFCIGTTLLLATLTLTPPSVGDDLIVRGKVETESGSALSGADVRLLPIEDPYDAMMRVLSPGEVPPQPLATTTAGAEGSWQLTAPVGLYELRVARPDAEARVDAEAGAATTQAGPQLFLPLLLASDSYPPTPELATPSRLRITVTAAGRPVPGALVRLSSYWTRRHTWRPTAQWLRTGADGVAEFEIDSGQRLRAAVAAEGFGPVTVAVTSSRSVELPTAAPRPVRVEDGAGQPVAGAVLAIHDVPVAVTGDDGLATVYAPEDGLRIEALAPDGARGGVRVEPPAQDGESEPPTLLTMTPARALSGRVIDTDRREALANALVWAEALGIEPTSFAVTDGAGFYELAVPAPSLQLSARASGHFEASVKVPLSATAAPTLALRPAGQIWGLVVTADGEAVEGAKVDAMLKPESRMARFSGGGLEARSDESGSFVVRGLEPAAAYRLRVTADGFAPAQGEGRGTSPDDIAASEPVEIVLQRGARAFGQVLDEGEQPIEGATVQLDLQDSSDPMARMVRSMMGAGPTAESRSGNDGIFTFQNLADGSYRLEVKAPGFAPAGIPGIELPAGETEIDLGTLILSPGLAVSGIVENTDGEPLAGAQIRVTRRQGGSLMRVFRAPTGPADAVSGADGTFELVDLAPEEQLNLQAALDGYQDGSVDGVRVPSEEPARIVLRRSAEIHGRVVDDTGLPVGGADVGLLVEGGGRFSRLRPVEITRSDADGRFELLSAPPGALQITAGADGFQEAKLGLELEEAQRLEDVELTLRPGARVTGTVTDADGLPVVDARVAVRSDDAGGPMASLFRGGPTTDGDGRFVLEGLATGRQSLVATKEALRASKVVDVKPGTNRVDFRFASGVPVAGRVVDPEGLPAAEVRLTLQSTEEFTLRFSSLSRSDGTFRFDDVSPGSYRLIGEASGLARSSMPQPVDVGSDPRSGLELHMSRGQAVVGRLLGAELDDLAGAQVLAGSRGNMLMGDVDFEGGYRIGGLGPGRWTVRASLGDGRQASETVEIEEGLPETVVDLDFDEGETLQGEVFADAAPAQGVMISIRGLDVESGSFTQTDTAGRFEVLGLEPGRYRVIASRRQDGLTADQEVDVPGPEVRLELVSVVLEGRVLDAWDGSAVSGATVRAQPEMGDEPAEALAFILRDRNTQTDDVGRFRLGGLSESAWNLEVSKSGYAAKTQAVQVLADGTSVEISLEPSEGMWLTVSRADGAAVPKIQLLAQDDAGQRLAGGEFVPDEAGRVFVSTVPPGRVHVIVQAPGTAPEEFDALVPEERVPVVLERGYTVQVEVAELVGDPVRADAVLTGRSARNVTGVHRVLAFGGQQIDSFPLRRGHAIVSGVPTGTWTVTVTAADGRTWSGQAEVDGSGQVEVRLE